MKNSNFFRLSLFIAWTLFIVIALTYPKIPSQSNHLIGIDKLIHFFLFFIFSILFLRSGIGNNRKKRSLILWYLAVTVPIFGEVIQIPVPGREFSFLDMLANFCGFAVVLFLFCKQRYKKIPFLKIILPA